MAIQPKLTYPGQTDAADTAYPYGKAQNVATPGDPNGTPLEAGWLNDLWGFQQALLAAAGITPSGSPDKVGASDYLAAVRKVISNLVTPGTQTERRIALTLGTCTDPGDGWYLRGDMGSPVVWRYSGAGRASSILFPFIPLLPEGAKLDRVTIRCSTSGGYVAGGVFAGVAASDPDTGALNLVASGDIADVGLSYTDVNIAVEPVVIISGAGSTYYLMINLHPEVFQGTVIVSGLRARYTPATLV